MCTARNQVRSLWSGDDSLNSGALILEGSIGEPFPFLGTSLTLNHSGIMTALNSSWTDTPLSFASLLSIVYVCGPNAIITLTDIDYVPILHVRLTSWTVKEGLPDNADIKLYYGLDKHIRICYSVPKTVT